MTEKPPDAVPMVTDILTVLNRRRVIDAAAAHRLPAIYEYAYLARDGGLTSYGPDVAAIFDRAAGSPTAFAEAPTRPACRPVSSSRSTCRTLGLTFPASILVRADDVIE
jgi:putative ABC transport system substrate-binding protein